MTSDDTTGGTTTVKRRTKSKAFVSYFPFLQLIYSQRLRSTQLGLTGSSNITTWTAAFPGVSKLMRGVLTVKPALSTDFWTWGNCNDIAFSAVFFKGKLNLASSVGQEKAIRPSADLWVIPLASYTNSNWNWNKKFKRRHLIVEFADVDVACFTNSASFNLSLFPRFYGVTNTKLRFAKLLFH